MNVDQTAIKFNQVSLITLTVVAYLVQLPWLVGFVALVLALGTINPRMALFQQFYRHVLVPRGLLKPSLVPDDPVPHRFAQGMGATFLTLSTITLYAGLSIIGWMLAAIVVVLAAVNLISGFCAGCFMYYQLVRLGLVRERGAQASDGGSTHG